MRGIPPTVAANVRVSDHQRMRFTFVHAADIHLDRSLNGLRSRDALADLQLAPRQAFANLVDEAIQLGAAFVLLPGDIYDGAWKDSSTGLFFNAQMGRNHYMQLVDAPPLRCKVVTPGSSLLLS